VQGAVSKIWLNITILYECTCFEWRLCHIIFSKKNWFITKLEHHITKIKGNAYIDKVCIFLHVRHDRQRLSRSESWYRNGWCNWQVRPFRTESQLIGDIRHLNGTALGTGVGEGALLHQNVVTSISVGLQGTLLAKRSSIPGQITKNTEWLKKSFTNLKAYINLFRGYIQRF
jgi:hypothetical protein